MKQTDTPAFRRWFRNSVVVNEDGSPMVVYHGTKAREPFSQFNLDATSEVGFHFGTKDQARDFSTVFSSDLEQGKKPRIYPVYLSIQKPFCMEDVFDSSGDTMRYKVLKGERLHKKRGLGDQISGWCPPGVIEENIARLRKEVDRLDLDIRRDLSWFVLRGILSSMGYDGIVYHNENEGRPDRADNVAWIVWNPTQIKSAIGNRGTFDPDDPVITNPVLPPELGRLIEVGDTVLNYDSAQGEDFYDLYDLIYTRRRPTTGEIEEVSGMLNDNGVFAVLSGEPRDLGKYFQKVGVLGTVAVAQGPKNPEVSRINAEKKRRKIA